MNWDDFTQQLETLLPDNIYGFRSSRGTQDALTDLLDYVKTQKAAGKYVALLSIDATAAFDLLSHDLVLGSLKLLGFGPLMIAWSRSFFEDCRQFVQINKTKSESWSSNIGTGQGRKCSPDFFNVGYLTQVFLSVLSKFFGYADDGIDVVVGDSISECNEKIQKVAKLRSSWFKSTGLPINVAKSELLGFGFSPTAININGSTINPRPSIKFLGCQIQSTLQWDLHVNDLCIKLRMAASQIRSDGRLFCKKDKLTLFNGWMLGSLHSNCLVFLPHLNDQHIQDLQCAMNAGVRAVEGIPRRGQAPLSEIRAKLNIPSVKNVRDKVLMFNAWKHSHLIAPAPGSLSGPTTRARSRGNVPQPIQSGFIGKTTLSKLTCAWNSMPLEIKNCTSVKSVKALIKKHIMS